MRVGYYVPFKWQLPFPAATSDFRMGAPKIPRENGHFNAINNNQAKGIERTGVIQSWLISERRIEKRQEEHFKTSEKTFRIVNFKN
jgi:hypothetical protein